MNKINFTNLPSTTTPVNATNLNLLQTNVETGIDENNTLAVYIGGSIDPNTTLYSLILSKHANVPKSGTFYYIKTTFYGSIETSSSRAQLAVGYNNNEVWQRYYYNNSWSKWISIGQEEGTWTPILDTIEGVEPTVTYETQRGRWKKQGNLVFLSFFIKGKITALNGTNNYGQIKGLPFSLKQITLGENAMPIGVHYQLLANTENVVICPYGWRLRLQYNYGAGADAFKVTPTAYFQLGASGWCEIE